jgi:ADP-ribose pyrophosphatase YjhB (NUDIX family)
MEEITYQEHGFKVHIKEYQPIGDKLSGLREGKPFMKDGQLCINLDNKLCIITKADFEDEDGNPITPKEAQIDTDTCLRGVIIHDNKVVLLHRIKKGREYYIFPGGHLIVNEDKRVAIQREIKEETGLSIDKDQVELLMKVEEEGAGPELFYLIKKVKDWDKLIKINPDQNDKEVNEIIELEIDSLKNFDNVYPKEVVKKVLETQ